MSIDQLTLDLDDPRCTAARHAEKRLFEYYQLEYNDHFLPIPGSALKMRVTEIGKGEPLLVIPGNTGDVFPLIPLLAQIKGRRIIALNRPGGGLSEGMDHSQVDIRTFAVQCIVAVIDAFQLNSVDIVAHSMGAHWSLWTAMDQADRVRSLTLIGNPGNVLDGGPPLVARLLNIWPFTDLFFKYVLANDSNRKANLLRAMGSTQETIEKLPKGIGDCYYYFRRLPHYRISFTSLLKNKAPNIDADQLGQVKQPAILLLGDKDNFASVKTGSAIADAMADCTLHVIKKGSHLPWLEKPEECGRLINEFLTGVLDSEN